MVLGGVIRDFFRRTPRDSGHGRALARTDLDYVVLLGEGTFHQFHGGVATNAAAHEHPWRAFHDEYVRIRGRPYFRVTRVPAFIGEFPPEAQHFEHLSNQAGADSLEEVSGDDRVEVR